MHSPLLYHWQQRFSFEKRLLSGLLKAERPVNVALG